MAEITSDRGSGAGDSLVFKTDDSESDVDLRVLARLQHVHIYSWHIQTTECKEIKRKSTTHA